ncbi:MAG: AAA family ATPase, partial [Solirubrobacterales bacterium]|nr:AAA family ATPase [Solirubrobacterales bacterium]
MARDQDLGGVVLCGAAGVGKSRLAREALSQAESDGAVVHFVQATRSAATVALGAFAGLVAAEARSDHLYELMQRVRASLADHAAGRPLVVGVDDAQWLDPTSAAVTLELVNAGTAFVIATIRDGESAPDAVVSLWKDAGAQRIDVGLLSRPETERLVDEMLTAPLEREARRWVAETSQGNPLYVRELVLGARAGGALQQVDGLWRLLNRPRVSASLKELITARMAGLDHAEHRLLELLALGEPLRLSEAIALAGVESVTAAEERGVVSVEGSLPDAAVRLAHPLYGEVIRSSLGTVRGREARLRLVETVRARDSRQPEDTIRLARWMIDAGQAPWLELMLAASRAANNAADPDFGAALAERALATGGGLEAALLLARAHAVRNRFEDAEAVLMAAEPRIQTQDEALEYLEQQSEVLHWGLQRPSDLKDVLGRAASWWKDPEWPQHIAALQLRAASFERFGVDVAASTELLTGDGVEARLRRQLEPVHVANLFYSGRSHEALELALRIRPSIPLRTLSDSIALSLWRRVSLDSGEGWDELEGWMTRALEDGVRLGDHATIGQATYSLPSLRFLQGRYGESRAYATESERQMEQHDPVGLL